MQWIVVGLGNPGKEYVGTRHNIGRDFLTVFAKKLPPKTKILLPDSYMNSSGVAVRKFMENRKQAEQLIVIHDDLDLPLGTVRLSFGSGAGGHKGVGSIQKALKTKDFIRIRIGISPATPSGKLKKPDSSNTIDFVLGRFRLSEQNKLKKVYDTVAEAANLLMSEGREKAMTEIHSRH